MSIIIKKHLYNRVEHPSFKELLSSLHRYLTPIEEIAFCKKKEKQRKTQQGVFMKFFKNAQ